MYKSQQTRDQRLGNRHNYRHKFLISGASRAASSQVLIPPKLPDTQSGKRKDVHSNSYMLFNLSKINTSHLRNKFYYC